MSDVVTHFFGDGCDDEHGAPCEHWSRSGVDQTDGADPAKVWRCDACGSTGTRAEMTALRGERNLDSGTNNPSPAAESLYRIVCADGSKRDYANGQDSTAVVAHIAHSLKRTWDLADDFKARNKRTGPHRVQRSDDGGATWKDE